MKNIFGLLSELVFRDCTVLIYLYKHVLSVVVVKCCSDVIEEATKWIDRKDKKDGKLLLKAGGWHFVRPELPLYLLDVT